MHAIRRAITRARLRLLIQSGITALGWLTLAGLTLGLILVLIDRLLAIDVPLWSYAVVAGAVVITACVIAWLRRPTMQTSAAMIDQRLGLKDRLGTALFAASMDQADQPFAHEVIRDAQQAAGHADLKRAFPLRAGAIWGWVLPVAAVVAMTAVFMPNDLDLLGLKHQQQQRQAAQARAAATHKKIVQAKALVNEMPKNQAAPDAADPLQILKDLATLSQRDLTNPQLRDKAVARLSDIEDRLDQAKQSRERAFETMRNRMSRLDTGEAGPADRFADALRRGDFAAAQKELNLMAQKVANGDYSDREKQQLKEQLANMQKQLQQMAAQAAQQKAQAQQRIRKQLQHQGLSQQQIQQLQNQGFNQQAVQQALQQQYQKQGMNAQQAAAKAKQQAQQIQQQQQQGQGAQRQSQISSGLQSALGQMASSLSGQQGQQGQAGQQGRPQGQGQQQGRKQGQQQGQQQGQGRTAGQSGGAAGSSFAQGAWQAQRQLNQMAQMRQQLQRMGMAQSQLQSAMRNMQQGGGAGQRNSPSGRGGHQAGTGAGGNPLGQPRQPGKYQTTKQGDITQGRGRVIASWMRKGGAAAGKPTVGFDQAITSAKENAERAVTEDRVPRRYHEAIRRYFNQLPQTVPTQ